MEKKALFNTREVASFLDINEKVVYHLISEKGLPATKVTGKWLFPRHLVEIWLENQTINYPKSARFLPPYEGLLIICGSNDIFLDRTIAVFNKRHTDHVAVFGNLGSQGGIEVLGRGLCHIAASHILGRDEKDYNFDSAFQEFKGDLPVLVNFCKREQGLLVGSGNPKGIRGISDLKRGGIKIANRPPGTGTRVLLDMELEKAGMEVGELEGYDREFRGHMDVALEVLSGRADVALGIRTAGSLLGLEFIPLRWERYDLLISKERFFDQGIQLFLGLLHESSIRDMADTLEGYDLSLCGKVVFPQETTTKG
ncbi:MAG: helix-turn-helix transcriptional regulator [Desulfatiglans sp.]|jgi:excisionase family DNA binding protein|nr:helix-turn-helix transcriptional regulator [Thermodesulfobacteriota bacterium]MEE4352633.1 helix-turn-helix transcriptional regulator [Desulfatiglans sp.]